VLSALAFEAGASYRYTNYGETSAFSEVNPATWANNKYIIFHYNRAYSKLITKMKSDQCELGAAFAEWKKTAGMVTDRIDQMTSLVKAIRHGRFQDIRALIRVPSGFRPKARSFGGAVLEYSFGWAPTVLDIYSGFKTLTGGIPPAKVYTRSAHVIDAYSVMAGGTYDPPNRTEGAILGGYVKVQAGCYVELTNPNLWLANQLGLVNPIGIVWELTPFSFLVDYFINIETVINSWTDLLGVQLLKPYRTFVLEMVSDDLRQYGWNPPIPGLGKIAYKKYGGYSSRLHREPQIPGPTLRLAAPKVSLTRASTSISLLLQQLKGKR
jgi:hypothetical protein